MNRRSRVGAALLTLAVATGLGACSQAEDDADAAVTLNYWLWDDNQKASYQQCADAFHTANPNITVQISQAAWGQYWQNLTTQLASGDAPDVWTNQGSYYPQFVSAGQILDIQPYVTADGVDLSQYQGGLADLFTKDGKRFGLPKDWDTMAIVYNTELLKAQGIDPAGLQNLTWNPTDGGTFEQAIAKATVDANGHNGLDPAFDKTKVKTYGYLAEWADGSQGQNGWGNLAASNGFTYLDKNPWGTQYKYDDPKLAATIDWFKSLIAKGYSPALDKASTLSRDALMTAGKGAMTFAGSWMINTYLAADAKVKFALAPLPTGPQGRKSAINGLSDAIWAGTKHKDQAWKWVKFLGSADCQNIVGGNGVVFPAIKSATNKALDAHKAKGRDVQPFIDEATAPGGTFFVPVTEHGNEVSQIVQDAIQSSVLGQTDSATALKKANDQVNALFK
ncbi:multiple sugar transport system substrate-binding protein [Allocatelliglobosispora scoriae]|uniref:Multiple sugar transport system substrate-binding protein n=1 Tax=Allocatelliglobosispora scoriae TaxID=643052 RepID=A0A841BMD3_9ACTN|nr:sugar ABC transporter substrate-binding protein [Allocatelliglobosispora scoriae]MBB5868133.1 multiple sugar transport system substrate-binding protein [Allocatelliglobosispora scoriae]